jgi:hypothetical protein
MPSTKNRPHVVAAAIRAMRDAPTAANHRTTRQLFGTCKFHRLLSSNRWRLCPRPRVNFRRH